MFYKCSNLQHIVLSSNITSLPTSSYTDSGPCEHSYAMGFFGSCSSLVSINIPNGVTSIDKHAFCGCSSLTSITIPESVTSIGYYALCSCMFSEENFALDSVFYSHFLDLRAFSLLFNRIIPFFCLYQQCSKNITNYKANLPLHVSKQCDTCLSAIPKTKLW